MPALSAIASCSVLADREFIGGRWIKFLLENNILFAIRVKENSAIRLEDGRGYPAPPAQIRTSGIVG